MTTKCMDLTKVLSIRYHLVTLYRGMVLHVKKLTSTFTATRGNPDIDIGGP